MRFHVLYFIGVMSAMVTGFPFEALVLVGLGFLGGYLCRKT